VDFSALYRRNDMKIAVMGSGGVGGYFGAKLAHSGAEVHFIARVAHLAAMREHGLRIESPTGDLTIQPVNATDNPAEIGPADIVLFAVKLYDTEVAAEACRPLLGPETAVVTFQNGIDGLGVLRRVLGDAHVAGGVTYIAAGIAAPGVIRQTGAMARLIFGELDGTPSSRLQVLLDQCTSAGIEATLHPAILQAIWEKFVMLCTMSGLTTLARQPIGPIRRVPQTRALAEASLRETVAVARAHGVELPSDIIERTMAFFDQVPYEVKSSMLQDLEGGRHLEVSWLSGAVARLGAERGIATPVHQTIAATLAMYADGPPTPEATHERSQPYL
jgi:2-dehydropantoate 2-reductase